jgi:hypothetical protein
VRVMLDLADLRAILFTRNEEIVHEIEQEIEEIEEGIGKCRK